MSPRPFPTILLPFLEREEGEKFKAYQDQGGVWTDGVGHTQGVRAGDVVTQAQINANLWSDLSTAATRIQSIVGPQVVMKLPPYCYAALGSFVFNEGASAHWLIWAQVEAASLTGIANQLRRFIYVQDPATKKNVRDQGLINRRAAEINLMMGRDPLCALYPAQSAPTPETTK